MDLKTAIDTAMPDDPKDDGEDEPKFDAKKAFDVSCKRAFAAVKGDDYGKFAMAMRGMMTAMSMDEDDEPEPPSAEQE